MGIVQNDNEVSIDCEYKSSVIPVNHMQLHRVVRLCDGANVDGSLYGNRVTIEAGRVTVQQSVYSPADMAITLKEGGQCKLNSTVVARRSILVTSHPSGRCRVGGVVHASKAFLRNTIVYGGVFGEQIKLEKCVVLGNVIASGELSMTDCVVGSFKAGEAEICGENALFLPFGAAYDHLAIDGRLRCLLYNDDQSCREDAVLDQSDVRSMSIRNSHTDELEKLKVVSIAGRIQNSDNLDQLTKATQDRHREVYDLLSEGKEEQLGPVEKGMFALAGL